MALSFRLPHHNPVCVCVCVYIRSFSSRSVTTYKNTIRQSITQHLFYIHWFVCQGDMFRPSRPSSGPPRKQTQELDLFSWRAWGWPTRSKHVALTYTSVYKMCYRLTYRIYWYIFIFFPCVLHVLPISSPFIWPPCIWRGVQFEKLLITAICPTCCYFPLLRAI